MLQQTKDLKTKLHGFFLECVRVITVTKKPNKQEFITTVKVSGIGILLIGMIGFLIQAVTLLFQNK